MKVLSVVFGVIVVQVAAVSALTLDSAYVTQLRKGIAYTMCEQFDSARSVFSGMVARDSLDHAAMLYLAGVDHAEMMDREDYARKDLFELAADKAIAQAEEALKRGDDSAWAFLTIGNAQAYTASLEAKAGSWWTAMRRGLKAKGAYQEALELDPKLFDAYLGLGTYHFWKSAKTEFINWLPFVGDRKDDGVSELRLAVDSSRFSNDLALNSLVWIYLERKQPREALACAESLAVRYPDSRLVRWALAFSSYSAGRLHEAADHFGRLVTALEHDTTQNYFNLIECRYQRGKIFLSVHDTVAASEEFKRLLSYPVGTEVARRQKDKIGEARKLRDQLGVPVDSRN